MALKTSQKIGLTCGGLILFVGMIILIVSFHYVEYNEYVFKKYDTGNTVYTNKVYENGRYVWGPAHSKISFPRDYQRIDFEDLSVADSDGKELLLDVSIYYLVRKLDLKRLYSKFGTGFYSTVKSKTESIIKNTAPLYSIDKYLTNREDISSVMNTNVTKTLDTMWIDLEDYKLQLKRIKMSDTVEDKYLEAAIKVEEEIQTTYQGEADEIRAETDQLIAEYSVNSSLIVAEAEAEATRIKEQATASGDLLTGTARGKGIASIITDLAITNTSTRATFIKLMSILDNENIKLIDTDGTILINT